MCEDKTLRALALIDSVLSSTTNSYDYLTVMEEVEAILLGERDE